MTFKEIQDECVNFRFGENRRDSVKIWINRRMQGVWGEAEWPFKRVMREVQLAEADSQPTMPTGFRRAVALEDLDGNSWEYMDPDDFRRTYGLDADLSGAPDTYTVWGGQIYLNGVPTGNWTLSYLRRVCYYSTGGSLQEGLMTSDGDTPLWDPEHHFLLVMGAVATGLKLENDFTWEAIEQEYAALLDEMKNDILPPDTVGTWQYGRDNL